MKVKRVTVPTFITIQHSIFGTIRGIKLGQIQMRETDLPDEEIPSFSKYLREHSLSDVTDRISQGIRDQLEFGCFSPVSGYRLGYCTQVILGSIGY